MEQYGMGWFTSAGDFYISCHFIGQEIFKEGGLWMKK
jgi:hypothetical protein